MGLEFSHCGLAIRAPVRYEASNDLGFGFEALDILFRTRRLRNLCNCRTELERQFDDMAAVIARRLHVLAAADNLTQVPQEQPIRLHRLSGKRSNQWAVDVVPPWRLIFRAADPASTIEDDGLDLSAVRAIEVLGVDEKD
jgi:proteic killer suppression protein